MTTPLIDCHAHLGDPVFDADRHEVLDRARAAGVETVIVVGETLAEAKRNLDLCALHPMLRATAGLYPTHLDLEQALEIESWVRERRPDLVAIGEVGLDRWKVREPADLELQRRIFSRFVDLSLEVDLPLNVHSRSAGRQTIEVLLERRAQRVLLHAFDGRWGTASAAVEAGFCFSVPPSIVRSRQKQKLVRAMPLSHLVLETDSPVLGATAGERNEPAQVRVSLAAIAEIKGLDPERVAEAVHRNTLALFDL